MIDGGMGVSFPINRLFTGYGCLSDRLGSHCNRFFHHGLRGSKIEVATELPHQSCGFRGPTLKVQSRQEADSPHSLESFEPANLASPLFITDEELGRFFSPLNKSFRLPFVQLIHQQPDVCLIRCHAS